ncbi:MAG: hypothetical protein HYR56_34600 [Acidobacteria bacterium]|nr:hypothetical protein [Acidobacteriota bacterium]MBI3423601.1 hypothetical protein [Acidobacteriota bacterium]
MTPSTTEPFLREGTRAANPALTMTLGQRLLMIAAGYVPFLNVVCTVLLVFLPATGRWPRWTWCLAPAWLLLLPPLAVRALLKWRPLPDGQMAFGSAPFLTWWLSSQWQVIFNRLPWLEELLRLVPGLYSTWLRLWGARVGKFVYWTPGLQILDRSLLDIGDRVAFGAGVKISPHLMLPNHSGQLVLLAAPVRIGNDALVGAYSILLPGSWVGPGEVSPGRRILTPFAGWADGRKVEPPTDPLRDNA